MDDNRLTELACVVGRIIEFGENTPVWCSAPVSKNVTNKAIETCCCMYDAGFDRMRVYAGSDGNIEFAGYHGKLYVEIAVEADESITLDAEVGDDDLGYEDNLSVDKALEIVMELVSKYG